MVSISRIKDLGKEFPSSPVVNEIVGEDSSGQRIDNFLMKRLKGVPKSHVYQLLRSGQVRLNSKRVDAARQLRLGDKVRIPPVRAARSNTPFKKRIIKSELAPFEILFEDETLLVIDKPAGVAVHGGSGVSFGVIEQLRIQHPAWKFLELVHRLDRGTSGILFLAKSRAGLIELHRQIRAGLMEKRYLVLVKGKWHNPRQSVKLPLSKYVAVTGERRMAVITDTTDERGKKNGMTAHTVFMLKKSWRDFSLLEAELKTGRTHQIRVHLAHLGFPIVGDDKYGDFGLNKRLARSGLKPGLERMFLHAFAARVAHPVTGDCLHLEAPMARELAEFLDSLDIDGRC